MCDTYLVVTGGAGFIGSDLTKTVAKDNDVVVLDDVSTGKIKNRKKQLDNKKIEFIKGSFPDLVLLQKTFKERAHVFHAASVASVPEVFVS